MSDPNGESASILEAPNLEQERFVGVFPAWPYANGPRHLGHAASLLGADIIARYERATGSNVLMVSGTDEYGTPNMIAAQDAELEPLEFVTKMNQVIRDDFVALGMSFDRFSRTTAPEHKRVVQELFNDLYGKGLITEGEMLGSFDDETGQSLPDRYVEGGCPHCSSHARGDQCESCGNMLDPQELIDPKSKLTGNDVAFRPTQHMFLRLDLLKGEVKEWLESNNELRPNARAMSLNMVDDLHQRAITRDMEWGVPLPELPGVEGYDEKVLYVWFEAVIGYLSATIQNTSEAGKTDDWKKWWQNPNARQYYTMGKDNIPFHTLIWPSMLIGASQGKDVPFNLPNVIASTEYLTFNDNKVSSSRGNVIYIRDLIGIIGADSLRYYMISAGPETNDKNFSFEELVSRNNSELIANWGNLVNRVLNLANSYTDGAIPADVSLDQLQDEDIKTLKLIEDSFPKVGEFIEQAQFRKALSAAMEASAAVNKYIYEQEPWKKFKNPRELARAREVMYVSLAAVHNLSKLFFPFMPFSSAKVQSLLGQNDDLLGNILHKTANEAGFSYDYLTGDYSGSHNTWRYNLPEATSGIVKPAPLFTKLDTEVLIEEFDHVLATRSIGTTALKGS